MNSEKVYSNPQNDPIIARLIENQLTIEKFKENVIKLTLPNQLDKYSADKETKNKSKY
jgi:hypothetical protein|tara:strand:- start:2529 stop:2702 length:174 start_codon:yes stop_codon:yes gene_type:complete